MLQDKAQEQRTQTKNTRAKDTEEKQEQGASSRTNENQKQQ